MQNGNVYTRSHYTLFLLSLPWSLSPPTPFLTPSPCSRSSSLLLSHFLASTDCPLLSLHVSCPPPSLYLCLFSLLAPTISPPRFLCLPSSLLPPSPSSSSLPSSLFFFTSVFSLLLHFCLPRFSILVLPAFTLPLFFSSLSTPYPRSCPWGSQGDEEGASGVYEEEGCPEGFKPGTESE